METVGDLAVSQSPNLPISTSPGLILLPALADVRRRFRIPKEHFFAVLDGVEMDLGDCRFRTFAELAEYCDRVASAVGLACLHVWGFRSEEALPAARCCGRAFQLTNILRDLKEDAARGRIYLPCEDMDACAYSPGDLARGAADERFDPANAYRINGNPAVIPGVVRLGAAALIGAFIFWRTKRFDDRGLVAFTTLTLLIFFLQAQGWSPQWLAQIVPLLLLCFPTRNGVTLIVLLSGLVFIEYPFLFMRTGDTGGMVAGAQIVPFTGLVLGRTLLLVMVCVALYRRLRVALPDES